MKSINQSRLNLASTAARDTTATRQPAARQSDKQPICIKCTLTCDGDGESIGKRNQLVYLCTHKHTHTFTEDAHSQKARIRIYKQCFSGAYTAAVIAADKLNCSRRRIRWRAPFTGRACCNVALTSIRQSNEIILNLRIRAALKFKVSFLVVSPHRSTKCSSPATSFRCSRRSSPATGACRTARIPRGASARTAPTANSSMCSSARCLPATSAIRSK